MISESTRLHAPHPISIKLRPAAIAAMLIAAGFIGGWLIPHTKTVVISRPPAAVQAGQQTTGIVNTNLPTLSRADDYATRHLSTAVVVPRPGIENPALYPSTYLDDQATRHMTPVTKPLYRSDEIPNPASYKDDQATRHLGG
jgi:hypothetical protein